MGKDLKLTASDGHSFDAYQADPDGDVRGGVVIIQEIFGVNDDIRETVDNFAKEGYVAIAPALFDRHERDAVLGFDEDGMAKGRALKGALDWDDVIKDVNASVAEIEDAGKIGIVGFCMGVPWHGLPPRVHRSMQRSATMAATSWPMRTSHPIARSCSIGVQRIMASRWTV